MVIAAAKSSGATVRARIAIFACTVITSSASPRRHAAITCRAARSTSIVVSGSESEIANHAYSCGCRPFMLAFNGDPVRISPGLTVVTMMFS